MVKLSIIDLFINEQSIFLGKCQSPYVGFVAYRKNLSGMTTDVNLTISGIIADRMQIILDGKLQKTIYSQLIGFHVVVRINLHLNINF